MAKQNTVGVAYFRVNQRQYALGGEMSLTVLKEKRNVLIGMDGSIAIQVEFQSPMVECQIRDINDADLLAVATAEDVTITVEMRNGTIWELSRATYTGEGKLDAKEGNFSVRFNGETIRRVA